MPKPSRPSQIERCRQACEKYQRQRDDARAERDELKADFVEYAKRREAEIAELRSEVAKLSRRLAELQARTGVIYNPEVAKRVHGTPR